MMPQFKREALLHIKYTNMHSFQRVCPKALLEHIAIIIIFHFLVILGDGLPTDLFIPMHLE